MWWTGAELKDIWEMSRTSQGERSDRRGLMSLTGSDEDDDATYRNLKEGRGELDEMEKHEKRMGGGCLR
jgi:hypothetical protein